MGDLFTVHNLVALFTLTVLEVVLGIDNVIFLAIVSSGVPERRRAFAQRLGLGLALAGRVVMVLGISWLLGMDAEVFATFGHAFTIKDLILLAGGIFLTYKAVTEIYKEMELREGDKTGPKTSGGAMAGVILQIMAVDMVFAIDSVLTAVGLTQEYAIIIVAMTIAVLMMMFYASPLSAFIHKHPSVKMLALAFLVLIGVLLLAESFGEEIDRTYVYAAILFSLAVEALNFRRTRNLERRRRRQTAVQETH